MKRIPILLLLLIYFTACRDAKVVDKNTTATIVMADTITEPKLLPAANARTPSKQFLRLAKQIDSAGFIWDTVRMKNVVHYSLADSIIIAGTYVFYKMKLADSWLIEFYKQNKNNALDFYEAALINYDYFKNVKSITGYYYTQKQKTDFREDGYIEEWTFPRSDDAERAVEDVQRVKEKVYFNTQSFCCRIDDKLYIFHTRAMGFSGQLKKFFQQLVADNNAVVPKPV